MRIVRHLSERGVKAAGNPERRDSGAMPTDLRPRFARKPEAAPLRTPGVRERPTLRPRASEKQMAFLLALMDKRGVSRDSINVLGLTMAEAAGLIHEMVERETRLPWPSPEKPHPAFMACSRCGVRTCDHASPLCPGGHPGGPCSWRASCWNCESPRQSV